jgi:hypothetical protein
VHLLGSLVMWVGREEDPADDGVWAVSCFVTRMASGAGAPAMRSHEPRSASPGNGARAIEGYPMITQLGQEITWGELNVGSRSVFAEVSRPTRRRVVMRIDF